MRREDLSVGYIKILGKFEHNGTITLHTPHIIK